MVPVFLILYGGDDESNRYGAESDSPYDAGDGYSSGSDAADRYLREFFNGADSYLDVLFGGDQDATADEYRQADQEPYDPGGRVGGYRGPTVITVVYREMYDSDYGLF